VIDVRELTSPDDLDAAFVLRHRICVEELGWVPAQPDGRERDEWDDDALHIGAFDGSGLVGYIRVVPDSPRRGIMTHRHFGAMFIVSDPRPPVGVTGDLSRLVIDAGHRDPHLRRRLSIALVNHAQYRSQDAGLGFWYLVNR
jgi:N-acyl-L-homoserine lactone synthetase